MVRAGSAIVRGDHRAAPIAPAEIGRGERRRCRGLFGACEEPIGLAERMLRNTRALQDVLMCALRDQRASGQLPALSVSPASREHAAARRVTGDHGECAPVLLGDGIEIEHMARQDVGWDKRVFRGVARPVSFDPDRVEA